MATFEYTDVERKICITSDETIELLSSTFVGLLRSIDTLNDAQRLISLILTTVIPQKDYTYSVLAKNGVKLDYLLFRQGNNFTFSITTAGTIWVPKKLLLNTGPRRQTLAMIVDFGMTQMEITYF